MTLVVVLELVTAVLALLATSLGFVNRRKIHDVHIDLNSRLSQLVEAEFRRGLLEGTASEQLRASQLPVTEGNA